MKWTRSRTPGLAIVVSLAAMAVTTWLVTAAASGPAPAAKSPPAEAKPTAAATAAAMTEAARKFLGALSPAQKEKGHQAFTGSDRESFVYVPAARSGVPLKELDGKQRALAHELLRTGLASAGYQKATRIIELETVLAELERNPVRRDPEKYYVWIFGDPNPTGRWGWKFEGHHLSLNFTLVDGKAIASVPAFWGANPAEVRTGPQAGRRAMDREEDLARELVLAFSPELRKRVIFDEKAPPEILTGDDTTVTPLPSVGLEVAAMPSAQRELVRRLLAHYASTLPAPLAATRLARINDAGFEKVRFGWAGATDRGQPHYYRLAGPTFVLEYDNTQNGANHVHTVWRDFEGDFGRDLLREHRKASH